MKLLTKELEKKIPGPRVTEKQKDPVVYTKFFHPYWDWEWYPLEYDPKNKMFFGLVHRFEDKLGYFSIDELESTVAHGSQMERDRYFKPTPLSKIREQLKERSRTCP